MSANNILCLPQHSAVLVASDTAVYTRDGIVRDFASKILPVGHWPGIVTGRGTAIAAVLLSPKLATMFSSFDDLIAGIEAALPLIVARLGVPIEYELLIAGWSEARQAPESYMIQTSEMTGHDNTADELDAARAAGFIVQPYTLAPLPACVSGPPLRADATIDATFEGFPGDGSSLEANMRVLRLVLEAQRHQPDRNGFHWVGGAAELAIVTPDGVQMMEPQHWNEDRVGDLVRPAPIDWDTFRARIGMPPGYSLAKRTALKAEIAELDRQIAAATKPISEQIQTGSKKPGRGTLRLASAR
jgi:hypothetical protein